MSNENIPVLNRNSGEEVKVDEVVLSGDVVEGSSIVMDWGIFHVMEYIGLGIFNDAKRFCILPGHVRAIKFI